MTARLYLTVYADDDLPTEEAHIASKSLGTVTACSALSFKKHRDGSDALRLTINRHHPQAALLKADRYVIVHSDAGPVGGALLEEAPIDLSADDGPGDEWMEWTGRGSIAITARAAMDNTSNVTGGMDPVDGFWDLDAQGIDWGNQNGHPIPMLKRVMVETQLNTPNAIPMVDHSTWDYQTDSTGATVPFYGTDFGSDVGESVYDLIAQMSQIGGVVIQMGYLFDLKTYLTFGTDRSGAFGAGTVRFEKSVNIAAAIQRKIRGSVRVTHLIVGGAERTYVTVTDPDYVSGDVVRYGFLSVPESSDTDTLTSAGLAHIALRKRQTDVFTFPLHTHGDDPANGIYEPAPDIADGHFWVGDTVSVHTGTGEYDANEEAAPIAAITWQLKTGDEANGDYDVIVEIGSTFHWDGAKAFAGSAPGSQHRVLLCTALTPGTETITRLYHSAHQAGDSDTPESFASPNLGTSDAAAGWDYSAINYYQLYSTPQNSTGTGSASWSAVNAPAGQAFGRGYVKKLEGDLLAAIQSGGTARMQIRVGARYGTGIDESVQQHTAAWAIRVYRPSTSTFIGTALALSTAGATNWPAQATQVNRTWLSDFSGVAGAVEGDYLVVDIGANHTAPTSGGTGTGIFFYDGGGASDLPEDESSTSLSNSWLELRSTSAPSGSGLHPDIVGTSKYAKRCDGTEHVQRDRDPTTADNSTQGYPVNTHWLNTETGRVFWLADAGAGTWVVIHDPNHTHDSTGSGSSLPWFTVTDYGATGDGSTDDTSAINDAIAALNTAGAGVLYFPAGDYKVTSALTAISARATLRGDGAHSDLFVAAGTTRINCTSATAVLFTFSTPGWYIQDIALYNSATTPSAGSAVYATASDADGARLENVTVVGFYDLIDLDGGIWTADRLYLRNPTRYGVRIRNAGNPDQGDYTLTDVYITDGTRDADAAIRYESGGGLKISGLKVNGNASGANRFDYGIDFSMASSTVDLLLTNSSIENVKVDGIRGATTGSATFRFVVISGNQFGLYTNDIGYAINLSAASAGNISHVVIANNVFHTGGTARSAVNLTNIDHVTLAGNELSGFDALYDQSGSTNITEVGGSVGELDDLSDVAITSAADGDLIQRVSGTFVNKQASAVGHYELLMTGSSPPDPLEDGTGNDWLYVWVND